MKQSLFFYLLLLFSFHLVAADFIDKARREDRYKKLEFIGNGAYGAVFKYHRHVIKLSPIKDDDATIMNILEAALLRTLSHEAIPSPIAIKIHRGDMDDYLEVHLPFYQKAVKDPEKLLREMVSVLSYLHELNIAHRDIKPPHLLRKNDSLVLIDWGCADIFTASPIGWCGTTLNYRSPESLGGESAYPKANDMWSIAVSLLEICRDGDLVFKGNIETDVLAEIKLTCEKSEPCPSIKGAVPPECKLCNGISSLNLSDSEPLFLRILDLDQHSRITATELKEKLGISKSVAVLPSPSNNVLQFSGDAARLRRSVYLWLHRIMKHDDLDDKVLFEAMSIADRFFETSKIRKDKFQLVAAIAIYLATGFYDQPLTIKTLLYYSGGLYSKRTFRKLFYRLLINAHFKLIFNHSLRAYQNIIYGEFGAEKRIMAIALLTLLEMDEETFSESNERKWQLLTTFFSDKRDENNLLARKAVARLCERFKNDVVSDGYTRLCRESIALLH